VKTISGTATKFAVAADLAALLLLLSAPPFATIAHAAESERPANLIVILADDLGYGDVCAYGCTTTRTPNIDAIARSGARFTQGYVTAPVCSPSRAGLMTGRYQQRFGHELNAGGIARAAKEGLGTPLDEQMLPKYLKDLGYTTGMVGKWHLGSTEKQHPMSRGFDEFFGFLHGGNLYLDPLEQPGVHFIERGPEGEASSQHRHPANPILRGREPVVEPAYLTEAFTREAVSFIERHRAEPFFLYVAYNAPHTPLQTTDEYYDRFPEVKEEGHRVYAAMLSALDDGVGAITAALDRTGLGERTLVVFTSDNGCATYTESCSNGPLLGGKLTPFEGGFRVPFLATWKGTIAPGRVIDVPVSTLDLLPTALELAHPRVGAGGLTGSTAKPPPGGPPKPLDGESLLPLLRGERDALARDTLIWRLGDHYAVRKGDWKLVQFLDLPPLLFDLRADPGERHDLAPKNAETVEELQALYRDWKGQTVAPLWTTRLDLWVKLQDLLDGKPLKPLEGPGPGRVRFPV
jgi:arylsulfatase A-like enzyme